MENTGVVKRKKAKKKPVNLTELHWSAWEVRELPHARQLDIAIKLHDYVRTEDKYSLWGFTNHIQVSRFTFTDWLKRYPIISHAYAEAKNYLAAKRFDAGASGKGREALMKWSAQYDEEAFAFLERLEELKKKSQPDAAPTKVEVYMQDFSKKGDE